MLALAASCQVFAQDRDQGREQGRDTRPAGIKSYTGFVVGVKEPDNLIRINDDDVPFERDRITVRYQGREVDKFMLTPGLNIRYTLDRDGYLRDVFLLSPRDVIEGRLTQ
jgi:hypothetical protein